MKSSVFRRFRRSLALGAALVLSTNPVVAQTRTVQVQLEAQPLAGALELLARQTGTDILFRPEAVAGLRAPALKGSMSARAAAERLLAGTSLMIAQDNSGALLVRPGRPVPAPSADGEPGGNDLAEDEIVVTGDRLSQKLSIEKKRETFNVADVVSSDDIGRLPDHNTAAALRRIPGVSVQEDQGEPRFPVLRGLSSTYNRTSINGSVVASVDNSARTVPLDIVPSTLASSLEVFKTITPDMDPNAIGGTINIVTKSAFSEDGFFFFGQGALGDYEQSGEIRGEKLSWRANATGGTRFGPDGQFGIVASLSYQIRDSDIPQVETASPSYQHYTAAGAPVPMNNPAGNGRLVPIQQRLFLYNNIRERLGGALTLEWQPDPSLYLRAFGTYNRMEDDEERSENRLEPVGNVTNQTDTSGTFATGRNIVGLGRFQINRSIWSAQFTSRYEPSDNIRWNTDLLYSGAKLDNPESTEEFRTPGTAPFGFSYDFSDPFFFKFNPTNPAAIADPANYGFASRTELQRNSEEDVYEARSDIAFTSDAIGDSSELKLGGVYRSTKRDADQDFATLTLPATSGLSYTLANAFTRAPVGIVGGYLFDLKVDSDAANAFVAANRNRFTIVRNDTASDYSVDEDVYGGFIQGKVVTGDVTVIGGLRYERTDLATIATRTVNGVDTPANRDSNYDNWLPSIHVRWNAAPRLVVRGAWTNTIGRPDFGSITAREAISFSGSAIPTLSRGNPDLKPRESEGFDASIEYYPPDGLMSLAVFHKRIKNEIYTLTTLETIDLGVGRGPEQVQVSQPQNANASKLFGVEAAVQQSFTFLPQPFDGLGVNLNATYVDSDVSYVTPAGVRNPGLFLQPEWTANATLFYQKAGFEGRVSYNYIGGFLETINGTIPQADQYWRERGVIDAQISYRLNEHLELFVEGENLTDAGRRELTGPNRDLLQEAANYGRVFWAGASVKF